MCKIVPPNEFVTLADVTTYFKDIQTCIEYLEYWRWGDTVKCVECNSGHIYKFKCGAKYKCAKCGERFNLTSGTIFHCSKIPLVKWIVVIFIIRSHKKKINSYCLSRLIGVQQRTAWFMLKRISSTLSTVEL